MSAPSSARIVAAIALPSISWAPDWIDAGLACNAHRPRFPNHHDFDLPGILELALDFARDLVRQPSRAGVIHSVGRRHDAHFAACLDREHLFDALKLRRELLELRQPFHIGLERLAAGAGARARDGIRGLGDHAHPRVGRDGVGMRRDAIDYDPKPPLLWRPLDPPRSGE